MPLTFISRSSDFVNILRRVMKIYVESRNKVHFSAAVVAVKMKPCIVIMPPTLKKLMGHIAFGACVGGCVRGCVGHTFCTYCNF